MPRARLKPFVSFSTLREVNRPELTPDLAEFYSRNEGVGLESSWQHHPVRLCQLDEVVRVGWKDLYYGLAGPVPEGWERCDALRIGVGMFFSEVLHVLDAPSCPPGAVLAVGSGVPSPGGDGTGEVES